MPQSSSSTPIRSQSEKKYRVLEARAGEDALVVSEGTRNDEENK